MNRRLLSLAVMLFFLLGLSNLSFAGGTFRYGAGNTGSYVPRGIPGEIPGGVKPLDLGGTLGKQYGTGNSTLSGQSGETTSQESVSPEEQALQALNEIVTNAVLNTAVVKKRQQIE